MKNELLKLITKLVSFKTVDGNPKEKIAIVGYCKKWFEDCGIEVELYDHVEAPSMIAVIPGDIEKTVMLGAHLDVVPAPDKMFEVTQEEDILYGRGVLDDKGPAAILMLLSEKLKDVKNRPTVKILFTSDEEIGSVNGTARLMDLELFNDVDAVCVIDAGDEDEITYKHKGMIHVALEANGKAAHGAMPWKGENAINKIWKAYEEILKIFSDANMEAPGHWHPTVNIGEINGGVMINQVSDHAEMGIDIRFTEKYSSKELVEKIEKAIVGLANVKKMNIGELLDSDRNDPVIKKYIEVMEEVFENKIKLDKGHGATDARFFNVLGVPAWLHYPKGGDIHSEGEWADLSSMEKMIDGLEKFVLTVFKK